MFFSFANQIAPSLFFPEELTKKAKFGKFSGWGSELGNDFGIVYQAPRTKPFKPLSALNLAVFAASRADGFAANFAELV